MHLSDFIFNLYELFPAFVCADNIGSLVNNLFGVKLFKIKNERQKVKIVK